MSKRTIPSVLILSIIINFLLATAQQDYSSLSRDDRLVYLRDNFGITGDSNFNPDDVAVSGDRVMIKGGNIVLSQTGNHVDVTLNGGNVDVTSYAGSIFIGEEGGVLKGTNGKFIFDGGGLVAVIDGEVLLSDVTLKEGSTLFGRDISGNNIYTDTRESNIISSVNDITIDGKNFCCETKVVFEKSGDSFTVQSPNQFTEIFVRSKGRFKEAFSGSITYHNDAHKTIGPGSIYYQLGEISDEELSSLRKMNIITFSRWLVYSHYDNVQYYESAGACLNSISDCLEIDEYNNLHFELLDDFKEGNEQTVGVELVGETEYTITGKVEDQDKKFIIEKRSFDKNNLKRLLENTPELIFTKGKVTGKGSISKFPGMVDYDLGNEHRWQLSDIAVGGISKKIAVFCSECAPLGYIGGIADTFNGNTQEAINKLNNDDTFWNKVAQDIKSRTGNEVDKSTLIQALRYFDDSSEQVYMDSIYTVANRYDISPSILAAQMQIEGGREFLDRSPYRYDPGTEVDAFTYFGCDDCAFIIDRSIENGLLPSDFKDTAIKEIRSVPNEKGRSVQTVIFNNIGGLATVTAAYHILTKNDIRSDYQDSLRPSLISRGIQVPETLSEDVVSDLALFSYNAGFGAAKEYLSTRLEQVQGDENEFQKRLLVDEYWQEPRNYIKKIRTEQTIYEYVFEKPDELI